MQWRAAYEQLVAADRVSPLDGEQLERLAVAAYLLGRDAESIDALTRAHAAFLAAPDAPRAAREAFWLAFVLISKGERARAGGWLTRARRLLDECGRDCVECGYLLVPLALQHVDAGEIEAAEATFAEAAAVGARFADPDLLNLANQGRGRTLLALGRVPDGLALLDEVMVAVTAGEVSPILTGTIYCSVISACSDVSDVRRAHEWTDALNDWCRSQPDVVPYRGECLVRRAELMVLHGHWDEALDEATRAREWLEPTRHPALGAAWYQTAEIHRLRGMFDQAEAAYQRAMESGRVPYPGLGLLRLAQGQTEAARAALQRLAEESRDPRTRARVLPALVEVLLADGACESARTAADELVRFAAGAGTPLLQGLAAVADGSVLLSENEPRQALAALRRAVELWRDLDAPYHLARASALAGVACRMLGDVDGAAMELTAAARTLETLGAVPEAARLQERSSTAAPRPQTSLTARELDVLRRIAAGRSNRQIATDLGISEKTVARHVSNILGKLDVPSRAAATAYAFTHRLIGGRST